MKKYFHNLFVAFDQLFNAIVGGWPDETYSSRAWREKDFRPWRVKILDFLFGENHCHNTWNWERLDMHSPEEFRNK